MTRRTDEFYDRHYKRNAEKTRNEFFFQNLVYCDTRYVFGAFEIKVIERSERADAVGTIIEQRTSETTPDTIFVHIRYVWYNYLFNNSSRLIEYCVVIRAISDKILVANFNE